MGTHCVTIELPEDSYNYLRSVVDSGEYVSESDVILESLAALRSDPLQHHEALNSWMLEEVLPAVEEYDTNPASGFTPEELHRYLGQANQD